MRVKAQQEEQQVAWHIDEWCKAVRIGRTTFYNLEGDQKPRMAKVRGRRIVCEAPDAWYERIGE